VLSLLRSGQRVWHERLCMTENDRISIREYIESLFEAQEALCDSRRGACSAYMSAAMDALEKRFDTIFVSMDRALTKAENAQRDYNERSNEFRGQLDDQAKLLAPRSEVQLLISALRSEIQLMVSTLDERFRDRSAAFDARFDRITNEISILRDSIIQHAGEGTGKHQFWGYVVGVMALVASLATIVALIMKGVL